MVRVTLENARIAIFIVCIPMQRVAMQYTLVYADGFDGKRESICDEAAT